MPKISPPGNLEEKRTLLDRIKRAQQCEPIEKYTLDDHTKVTKEINLFTQLTYEKDSYVSQLRELDRRLSTLEIKEFPKPTSNDLFGAADLARQYEQYIRLNKERETYKSNIISLTSMEKEYGEKLKAYESFYRLAKDIEIEYMRDFVSGIEYLVSVICANVFNTFEKFS